MTNASRRPLYTGVTGELLERVWEHKNKVEHCYTSRYNLTRLVHFEEFAFPDEAIAREKELKGWSRAKKAALIESKNPRWDDLAREWGTIQTQDPSLAAPGLKKAAGASARSG